LLCQILGDLHAIVVHVVEPSPRATYFTGRDSGRSSRDLRWPQRDGSRQIRRHRWRERWACATGHLSVSSI